MKTRKSKLLAISSIAIFGSLTLGVGLGAGASAALSSGGFLIHAKNSENAAIQATAGMKGHDAGEVGSCSTGSPVVQNPNSFTLSEISKKNPDGTADQPARYAIPKNSDNSYYGWIDSVQSKGGEISIGKPKVVVAGVYNDSSGDTQSYEEDLSTYSDIQGLFPRQRPSLVALSRASTHRTIHLTGGGTAIRICSTMASWTLAR